MSHLGERKENNCLNCNAVVHGKYCHICGQENIPPKETVMHLVSHFFQDITHFDGKFFSTIKLLIAKPGYLSLEYMAGRRASYLNPIRLYVFTSAFFFLFFFKFVSPTEFKNETDATVLKAKLDKLDNAVKGLKVQLSEVTDSVLSSAIKKTILNFESRRPAMENEFQQLAKTDSLAAIVYGRQQDSLKAMGKKSASRVRGVNLGLNSGFYRLVVAFDSVQSLLPEDKRATGIKKLFLRKMVDIYEKSTDKKSEFGEKVLERFVHLLPQMLFVSLPIYAFFLLILYWRRKQYYYVNHVIYTIHLFCAIFLFTFIGMLLVKLFHAFNIEADTPVNIIFLLATFFYQYKSMRSFYQQRRAKTIFKFILLNLGNVIILVLLTTLFFLITLWNT